MTNSQPTAIPTTLVPPAVDAARRLLSAALDSPPTNPAGVAPDQDDSHRLAIAEALAVLSEVTPPYPPLPADLPPIDPVEAIRQARGHLESALDQVGSVQDLTRIGLAGLALRHADRGAA